MIIKCFALDSLSNYTQSALVLQTASGSAHLATPTPPSHSSPLLETVFRLTKTTAKAARFFSSFTASSSSSSSSLCRLLPSVSAFSDRQRPTPASVRRLSAPGTITGTCASRTARDVHLSRRSSRGSRLSANQRATLTPLCSHTESR